MRCFFLAVGALCVYLASDLEMLRGQQIATTVQLPTFGVAIDAEGVLRLKTYAAPDRRLLRERLAAVEAAVPADILADSTLRKISLPRLEAALAERLAAGEPPAEAMRFLAGLQRLQYVFCYPESGELVIAGPAEGWIEDASGRIVGVRSGRPVVQLEDLLVSLRAYAPRNAESPFVGCTISPTQQGLARLQEFQRSIPGSIPNSQRAAATAAIARGVRDSLGMADIQVYGISDRTRFAHVLIEADYRMKRIAIGLEPPPVRMTTFIDAVGVPRHLTLQRWWFTPHYDCVKVSDDRLAMELVGQGVQLQSQDKRIAPDGRLVEVAGPRPSKAAQLYTQAFTNKYPEIAAVSPVYAQLRNQIDLLIAAAFIRQQDYYGRIAWEAALLMDESQLATETQPRPRRVACAVNVLWNRNRLLVPAGGGVSIQVSQAMQPGLWQSDKGRELAAAQARIRQQMEEASWWWD